MVAVAWQKDAIKRGYPQGCSSGYSQNKFELGEPHIQGMLRALLIWFSHAAILLCSENVMPKSHPLSMEI